MNAPLETARRALNAALKAALKAALYAALYAALKAARMLRRTGWLPRRRPRRV